jgi:hypothetical protein
VRWRYQVNDGNWIGIGADQASFNKSDFAYGDVITVIAIDNNNNGTELARAAYTFNDNTLATKSKVELESQRTLTPVNSC